MFLPKLIQFAEGYVVLCLKGNYVERFLNICMRRSIKIWGISRKSADEIQLCMKYSDFFKIRAVAYKTHTHVHIIKKCGLYRIWCCYKHRMAFVFGMLFVIAFFFVATKFVWSIEIVGARTEDKEKILAAAGMAGVEIGAYKPNLPDGNDIKNIILTNVDDITWAWVYLKGTKAVIEVRKTIEPPKVTDKKTPYDIVALQDGIVKDIVVKEGIAFCKRGDTVLKGDLLIGGTMTSSDGSYHLKHAMGDVCAITQHTRKATIKLYRKKRIKTGRKVHHVTINCFGVRIPFYKGNGVAFEEYFVSRKIRELKLGKDRSVGVEIVDDIYEEETVKKIPLTLEMAFEAACYELEAEIAQSLLPKSNLIDKESTYSIIDEETIEVKVTMRFEENIGGEVPLNVPNEIVEEKQE